MKPEKNDMTKLEKGESYWMIRYSIDFAVAANMLLEDPAPNKKTDYPGMTMGGEVLLCLSVEIGLKALICWVGGKIPKKHNLLYLYEKLDEDDRNWLERKLPRVLTGLPEELYGQDPNIGGIRTVLECYGNAFTDWRYPYEARGLFISSQRLFEVQRALVELYSIRTSIPLFSI